MKPLGIRKQDKFRQQVFNTLYLLRIVISNTRLYSPDHPKTREMILEAYKSLNKSLQITKEITILIIDNDIIINNKAIRAEETDYFALFITVLKQKAISHIVFRKGITLKELTRFLFDLASPAGKTVYSSPTLSSGKLGLTGDTGSSPSSTDSLLATNNRATPGDEALGLIAKLKSLSSEQLVLAQELYFSIRKKQDYDLRGVRDSMSTFVNLFSSNLNPLSLLTALKTSDDYTFTHVINVCILTLVQAESLGFTDQHLYDIGITATLYDIGKTFVPEEILNKPEKLNLEEQKVVKAHAVKGAGYLLNLNDAPKLAVLAALEHHIRFDGGGYPAVSKTWSPNIVSQMIAIADTFDAMRCSRPYRKASPEKLIYDTLIKEKGLSFHPFLVDNFISVLSRHQAIPRQNSPVAFG